ncbi:MAG: DUF4136 domain-containing protein [Gemmatimonadota bacterium]|jgi:hypothetical protein
MRRILTALAISLMLGACGGGLNVNSDYAPSTDFTPYRTWDYMPNQGSTPNASSNQLIDQRLRLAVEQTMEQKGYRRDTSDPDFYVGYQLLLDQQTNYETVNDYWGSGWNYGWYGPPGGGMSTSTTRQVNYTVGTLVVDFFDADERQLIWRGSAEGTVEPESDPEARQARANEAVSEILAQFPPGM